MSAKIGRPIGSGVVPVAERFFRQVEKTDSCWLWVGLKNQKGYGRLNIAGSMVLAHRLSWTLHGGENPHDRCVLHRCDVPACVNPAHLFLGTRADNNADMRVKGREGRAFGNMSGRRKRPECFPIGEKWPQSRLTENDVKSLRREYAAGSISFAKLGKKYGIGHTHAENIVKRRKWAHVQ